ncbi:MAG: PD40 domain-containing protein [Anaerolineae bacterium]|nr:PD40 domain-containing protein [Anaerolineae bacterium]
MSRTWIRIGYAFFCTVLIAALGLSEVQGQEAHEQYAYMKYETDGSASIVLVDPMTLETTTLTTIAVSGDESIAAGHLSPTGDWIVLSVYSDQSLALRLFNLRTHEVVSVIDDYTFPRRPEIYSGEFVVFAWSPDGRYLAFHRQTGEEQQAALLYDTVAHTLTDLAAPDTNQYQLSWSPDSSRVALFSMMCGHLDCTRAAIDIYDAASATLASSIDLRAFSKNAFGEASNFCELRWNTDGTRLSFFDYCDPSGLGPPREVQVVDLASGTITPATHLTPTYPEPARSVFTATVDTIWADSQTLLIGTRASEGEIIVSAEGKISVSGSSQRVFTLRSNTSTQTISPVTERHLGQWSRASDHLFAYLAYEYNPDPGVGPDVTDVQVEIAAFDGQTLTPLASGPSGCFLSWNSRGDTLAYVEEHYAAADLCSGSFETLHFIDTMSTRTFTTDGNTAALGWYRPQ